MMRTAAALFVLLSLARSAETADVDFAREIQPLLARRCFACHGPADQESGLALDSRAKATQEADSGRAAIVPGKPDESELLRRVISTDPDNRMPPEGEPLTSEEIDLLRTWIQSGADYSAHWAWQKPVRSIPPKVRDVRRVRNPIDRFVLARLDAESLKPSPPADAHALLRRLHLDLTGLPPSIEQLRSFIDRSSASPEQYESALRAVIDELLDSPHFGERWARHWLDLARYADSFGYERDDVRPNAWRYRDWAINAINRDLPYDRFIIEQLAGDLLPDATLDQQVAAGFNRMNVQNNESGINKEDYRNREIVDRINTTATSFLGITLGCCQCHDHKYDSYSQREYYQFYAFFNNTLADDRDIDGTPQEKAAYEKALAEYKAHEKRIKDGKSLLESIRKNGGLARHIETISSVEEVEKKLAALKPSETLLIAVRTSAADRTEQQQNVLTAFDGSISGRIDDANKALRQLSVENRHLPKPYIMTLKETDRNRRPTHVLVRGDFKVKGQQVDFGTPAVLNPMVKTGNETTPSRLDLARWITHPSNPLAARVAVNHIWKHLFGEALVRTLDDFGVQGEPPTHPELLDWLAVEFRENGWSRKKLIRTILMSSTYRQSSHHRPELQQVDPQNRLLARQGRFRVEAEIIRDLSLAASGLLYRKVGGPTIRPVVSPAVRDLAYKYKTRWVVSERPERYRRGLYIHFKRTNPYPSLITFDTPEGSVCTAMRNRSNSPLQALTTLNDPVFVEIAEAFAERILKETKKTDSPGSKIEHAILLALGRPARSIEIETLQTLYKEELAVNGGELEPDPATEPSGPTPSSNNNPRPAQEKTAWVSIARALLNLDEFITRE